MEYLNLDRFIQAQEDSYPRAYSELKNGKKKTHWMWYIFPQIAGLGHSQMTTYYAIKDVKEAMAYLENEELYSNLTNLCEVLLESSKSNPNDIFGIIDAKKLHSSMTLFSYAAELSEAERIEKESNGMPRLFAKSKENKGKDYVFDAVLNKFYNGEKDHDTEKILFFDTKQTEMPEFVTKRTKK